MSSHVIDEEIELKPCSMCELEYVVIAEWDGDPVINRDHPFCPFCGEYIGE